MHSGSSGSHHVEMMSDAKGGDAVEPQARAETRLSPGMQMTLTHAHAHAERGRDTQTAHGTRQEKARRAASWRSRYRGVEVLRSWGVEVSRLSSTAPRSCD